MFLLRNFEKLNTPEFKCKYENMYTNIAFKKGRISILYYPAFLLNRLFVIGFTVLFMNLDGL